MDIKIRQATKEDLSSLISLLSQLTTVGAPNSETINSSIYNNIYLACDNNGTVVGTITLLVEDKIIHNGSKVGHIEDVVVHSYYRKLGIGKLLIDHCLDLSKKFGCYKVILDCDEENIRFYEKCGFKTKGVCMRYDIN